MERGDAPAASWNGVNTNPHHRERLVLENLRRQGLNTCCPTIRKARSHARRLGTVLRPLVPGYRVGQQARISGGPSDGSISTILDLDDKDRLLVLLQVMHRGIKVRLGGGMVTPAYGSG